ncbi:MAG TPA: ABC transporter ATP-binding protein [Candidatus Limnocylindrales bacterium]|nr:ABC transporter ATP-binding protein [Candidatus Limnocylindrales bacterium]
MADALRVMGLCKSYPGFALTEVSFSLPEGYIMGFVGRNGAGKTTTIKCVLDMLARDGGHIEVLGHDAIDDQVTVKQDLGVVFDQPFYPPEWKVAQVGQALRPFYARWDEALFHRHIDRFGLPAGKRVRELSRGMGMKLMLAAALSHHARLLILDEPTSGLDPVARDDVLDVLADLISGGGVSVLFSTHITADLERIADYITFIDAGRVVFTGAKDDLADAYRMIHGGPGQATDQVRRRAIGLRSTEVGFSALVRSADRAGLPPGITDQAPSIDDVLIHIARQGDAR